MTIEIYCKYSKPDKESQFGLIFNDEDNTCETYIHWVWYYLGYYLKGSMKPSLFQFVPMEWKIKPKTYKYCNNAERQAKLIANYIKKKISINNLL